MTRNFNKRFSAMWIINYAILAKTFTNLFNEVEVTWEYRLGIICLIIFEYSG